MPITFFILFLIIHSVVSNYCQRELAHALQYNKRIIPLLIAPTPTSDIPEALRDLQYVDFTDNTCQADYDSDIDDILNILRQDHNYYEQHKFLLARALKWETENRKPSFLLRGHNLDNAQTWLRLNEKRTQHLPLPLHQELITASEAAKGQLGTEVFISYSRKDSDFARELNKSLQEAGKTTWFDQESISTGVDFEKEIFKGIDGADNFIFVLSPDAVESEYCEREVNYAASQNKRFINLLHRETDPDSMPKALRVINWIDFKNIPFKKSFPELIQAIELDREHAHQHTVLQQRASDWLENNSSKDFLLNITACDKAEIWLDTALSRYKQPAPSELQNTFIEKSRRAITKANRLRNALLTLATVGMIVAFILAVIAFVQMNKANESSIGALASTSKARLGAHDELGALQASVQAASQWRKTFSVPNPENERLTDNVHSALNEALLIIQERNRLSGHTGKVQAVLFHPNLPIIVSASSDETVKIWHKNGKHLADLQHKNEVSAVSISPDGKFLASASFEMVKIWEVNDWTDEKAFQSLPQYELPHKSIKVYDVTFSPDSQKIATASNDGHIRLWEKSSENWQQIHDNKMKPQVPVQAVRFSPNGKLLASASNDRTIKLWQVEHDTVQLKAVLEGHEGKVYAVAFISDAELASASVDTTIRLWNVSDVLSSQNQEVATTLTENRKIEAHANWVLDVQSSPDKQTLASASANGTVKLWSTDGSLLKVFINPSYTTMTTVSFSYDGESLAAAGGDKIIRLYDLKAASAMKRLEGHTSGIKDVDTGPNKQTMASTGTDGTVRIWDSQTHRLLGKLELKAHARDVDYITPHWLAVATYDNAVQFWQLNRQFKGNKSDTSLNLKGKVKSIAYNSSNKLFAISESEKIDIGKLAFSSESGIFNKLRGYAQHKINELQGVAKFSEKRPVLENRKKLPIQHKRSIKTLVFSPNGKVLASGGADGRTILWFFDQKGSFTQFQILGGEKEEMGHTDEVNNLGFSHDNRYLASVSSDNSIKLWQVNEGKLLHSIDSEDEDAHQDWLWDVSFAPQQYQLESEKLIKGEDFYLFVSGSADNTVKLWRFKPPQKPKLVRTIKGHEGWVRSVGFSGDGQYIVSAGADKKMILSEIQGFSENADLEKLLKKGCQILKDYLKHNIDLTKDERKICKGVD